VVSSAFENSPDAQSGETGVYRRAEVEGFAEWARATIDRLQHEVADLGARVASAEQRANTAQQRAAAADQRAADAVQALAARRELEEILMGAVDKAAEAAATAAAQRVEALLDEARARVGSAREPDRRETPDPSAAPAEGPVSFDDPVRDPLPPWDERLLAFPDEQAELPPIGPIFGRDAPRSA
jgi:hypothetical protein